MYEFPLCLPEEYLIFDEKPVREVYGFPVVFELTPNIIESYRNYYRAKIAKFYKRCEEQHDCCLYANKGKYCIRQNLPRWTRRQKPSWLEI